MRRLLYIIGILTTVLLASCNGGAGALSDNESANFALLRFEETMFGAATPEQLQANLQREAPKYDPELLNIVPQDPRYMAQVADMTADPTMREIYDTLEAHYHDLGWLQKEIAQAMRRSKKLDDSLRLDRVMTFAPGMIDYQYRAVANQHSILIALDQYVAPCFGKYAYFQLPAYIVALSTKEHIVPDALAAFARGNIEVAGHEMTLLDFMVMEGKVQYYLHRVLPRTDDTLLLRYSKEQMDWARKHTKEVWAYWVQHQLLFEDDYNAIFNFVEDAPKTNAFGDSAPRMTDYIGWKIVEAYMNKTHCSLRDLFRNTDSRAIMTESRWKPERY